MKKGLCALTVALLLCIGLVGYAATPEMWGLPDIIIGDQEDIGDTEAFLVFTDAFVFNDYYHWLDTGNVDGLLWRYIGCYPDDMIAINYFTPDVQGRIDATSPTASYRNLETTPIGGPNSYSPPGADPGSTEVAVVELRVDNFQVKDDQLQTVYSHKGFDGFTNEFVRAEITSVTMDSEPDWEWMPPGPEYYEVAPSAGNPFGMSNPDHGYDATSDALYITSTGSDNNFGFYQSGEIIPYEEGAAIVVTAHCFATPTGIPTGGATEAVPAKFIPQIRLRINNENGTLSQEMVVESLGMADLEVTTDSANPTTLTMVFDVRDQSDWSYGNADMYFSFDMIDFSAFNRDPGNPEDDEGIIAIKSVTIETYPEKMFGKEATKAKTYPTTTFDAMYSDFYQYATGFGATAPVATTDGISSSGKLRISASSGVSRGIAWHQLINTGSGVQVDDTKWYKYVFTANQPSVDKNAAWVRFRVFSSDFQRSIVYNLTSVNDASNQQLPETTDTNYNVYFCPQDGMTGDWLLFAFDYIDFYADWGTTTVDLSQVVVYEGEPCTDTPPSP